MIERPVSNLSDADCFIKREALGLESGSTRASKVETAVSDDASLLCLAAPSHRLAWLTPAYELRTKVQNLTGATVYNPNRISR